MILLILQDNEVVPEMNIIWNHSFSNLSGRECYKGEFLFFPNLFFNVNAKLKFGGMRIFFQSKKF